MKKVIGIGGILFTSPNPNALREWYQNHLGIESETWGAQFDFALLKEKNPNASQAWCPFPEQTTYFNTQQQSYMINFVVDNARALYAQLKAEGVLVSDEIEESEFGTFCWCYDLNGNKIELWEPPKQNAQ